MRFILGRALALGLAAAAPVTVASLSGAPQEPTACERVASLALANATVTMAQPVDAGAFTPPAGGRGPGAQGAPAPDRSPRSRRSAASRRR